METSKIDSISLLSILNIRINAEIREGLKVNIIVDHIISRQIKWS
jgi:hypothetical protein